MQSTKELFYIGKCQCDLKAALCSCGFIIDHLKEFMRDQNNVRRLTIPEFVPEVEEPAPTSTIIPTSVEETHLAYEPSTDTDEPSSNPQDVPPMIRGPYTPRYDASTQYLDTNLRGVVNNVIKDNSYYAHSENILLAMLFDDKKETRNIAIKKILHYRRNLYDPAHL